MRDTTDSRPIYIQIAELIQLRIVSGEYPPGSKLPPIREFSQSLGVNPNTLQRSLLELERDGLVTTQSTTGKYITTDTEILNLRKGQLADRYIRSYYERMESLGIGAQEALRLFNAYK